VTDVTNQQDQDGVELSADPFTDIVEHAEDSGDRVAGLVAPRRVGAVLAGGGDAVAGVGEAGLGGDLLLPGGDRVGEAGVARVCAVAS